MKQTINIFLREKPCQILIALKSSDEGNRYSSAISRRINVTYSHTVKIIHYMIELKLVKVKRHNRSKILELTLKGSKIADLLIKIKERI